MDLRIFTERDARKGEFDVLVIYMLSRLTRQGAAEALKIQQELAKCGVALVSTQEPFINTSDDNPFGVVFFALIAGLRVLSPGPASEKELGPECLPTDTVNCMIEMAEDGLNPSAIATKLTEKKARTPYGSLDEEAAKERLAAAKKSRKSGAPDNADAEWSPTVVGRILRDPRLAGFAIGPVDPHTKVRTILRDDNGQPVAPHTGFISPKRWYEHPTVLGRP